jgi:hypothetical protein
METTNRIDKQPLRGDEPLWEQGYPEIATPSVTCVGQHFNEAKKEIIKIIRDEQNMLCTDSEIAEKILVAVLRIYGNNK